MNFLSNAVSVFLVPLLMAAPVWAQPAQGPAPSAQPPAPGQLAPKTPGQLQLRLVDSDGARVQANTRTVKGIAVQVTDADGAPVSDAAVAFRFSSSGASATFADGSHSAVAYTDASGNAHVANFQWNEVPGAAALRITATKANSHAGLLLEQTLASGAAAPAPIATPVSVPSTEAEAALPEEVGVGEHQIATSAISAPAIGRPIAAPIAESAAKSGIPSEYVGNPYHPARLGLAPAISISNTEARDAEYHGSSKKKWIILGIAAGVGAGIAVALLSGKSGSASTAAGSGVTVGAPTISIGHP